MSSLLCRCSLCSSCVAPKEVEEPEEVEQVEAPEEPGEPEEQQEPAWHVNGLDGHIFFFVNDEVLESETVQAWHRDLFHNLRIVSTPPKVIISEFRDARRLFGANCDNKVTLRNPNCEGCEDIELLQFDPNFTSTEVVCRHPSCNSINLAAAKCGKRDLYLCPHHQQVLKNSISDALAKESVQNATSLENLEPGQFAGYTSLISLLEGAFHDAKNLKVQEAILNARNFLIITSTVLNPDHDNLAIALPPVIQILKLVLENRETIERLADKAIALLKEVIGMILSAFGVIYKWVSHALGNPGAQIGAGVGGFIGGLTSFGTGPLGWLGGVAVGSTLGGLIGNGIYNLAGEQRQKQPDGLGPNRQPYNRYLRYQHLVRLDLKQRQQETYGLEPNRQPYNQYPMYHFNGDVKGRLDLHFQFHQILNPDFYY